MFKEFLFKRRMNAVDGMGIAMMIGLVNSGLIFTGILVGVVMLGISLYGETFMSSNFQI